MDLNILLETIRNEFIAMKIEILNEIKAEINFLRAELLSRLCEKSNTNTNGAPPTQQEDPEFNSQFQNFELLDIKENPLESPTTGFDTTNDFDVVPDLNGDNESNYTNSEDILFPIRTIEDLEDIEAEISNDPHNRYVAELKKLVKVFGLNKMFDKVFSESLTMEMNVEGTRGKIPLKDYTHFVNALYDAVKAVEPKTNNKDFLADLRRCFRLHKDKIYKRGLLVSKQAKNPPEKANQSTKRSMENSINTIIQLAESQELHEDAKRKKRYTFPLQTFAEVEYLNSNINETNKHEYIQTLKEILKIGGLRKNFDRFLDKDLIMHYNFAGKQGKLPFNVYTNLLDLLFEALVDDNKTTNIHDFHQEIKNAFKTYKNRINKRISGARRAEREKLEFASSFDNDESQDEQKGPTPLGQNLKPSTEDQMPTLEDGKKYKHKFPLKTPFALEMMDKMITPENRHKYVRKLREMFKYGGIYKNFNRFMSDDLILQYNVRGTKNKRALRAHTNIIGVLFEAGTELKDGSTVESFLGELQVIFCKYKNRLHKRMSIEKKRENKIHNGN